MNQKRLRNIFHLTAVLKNLDDKIVNQIKNEFKKSNKLSRVQRFYILIAKTNNLPINVFERIK